MNLIIFKIQTELSDSKLELILFFFFLSSLPVILEYYNVSKNKRQNS